MEHVSEQGQSESFNHSDVGKKGTYDLADANACHCWRQALCTPGHWSILKRFISWPPIDFSFDRATWIYMNRAGICFCMLCFLMSVGWEFRNRNCSVNAATSVCLSLWKLGACGVAFTAERLYECAKFLGDIIGFQAQKLCNAGKHQVPLYLNCFYCYYYVM